MHEAYMEKALSLAKLGEGWVNPNPMVGAVIVKEGKIIGTGYHQKYGENHAERNAILNCTESPQDAVLYVTLEPCCHFGKTPPCTEAIIAAGIRHVVIGSVDPHPLVQGEGVRILRAQGILVTEGVLRKECEQLNSVFFHFIRTRKPYVVMKYAMTMDGKIATASGQSKWITGEIARDHVQLSRHCYTGIMVGVGTVLADDPQLTCRLPNGKNPVRIICDTQLRTPLAAQVVRKAKKGKTIIATCCTDHQRIGDYEAAGCEVMVLPQMNGQVNLNRLMEELGKKDVDSVLLEGGSTLNWAALNSGIVNKVQAYIAPKIFGGSKAKSPVGGMGVETPLKAYGLSAPQIIQLGQDLLLESEVI